MRREIPLLKNEGVCDPRIFAHRMILCTHGGIAQKAIFGPKNFGGHVEDFENRACAFFCVAFRPYEIQKNGPKKATEPTTTSAMNYGGDARHEQEMGV